MDTFKTESEKDLGNSLTKHIDQNSERYRDDDSNWKHSNGDVSKDYADVWVPAVREIFELSHHEDNVDNAELQDAAAEFYNMADL